MRVLKLLPLAMVLIIAGCGDKTPPAADATPPASAPVTAAVPATLAPVTPAPEAAAPAAPAPEAAAAPAAVASTASAGDLVKGEQVYTATCLACHATGVLGAPKIGDKAAWGPRIAQGIDTLHKHSIEGIRMMPPKGGNASLKDEDVKAAVDYMVSKAS
ncbi:MAG: c-type cytochrome [Herbaspirillum sp.]